MEWLSRLKGGVAALVTAFALVLPGVALAQDGAAKNPDAKCTKCHDEEESYPVLSIAKTRHGVKADHRTPTCQACHGESPTHTNKPEGVSVRPAAEVGYGKKTKTSIEVQNQTCINCHQGRAMIHWQGSAHDTRQVACTSCHNMHTGKDKVMNKPEQAEVCYACHKEQRALFNKPSRHPVKEGKVVCSDCHNSHGSATPKLLVRDSVANTCYTCHMEKRGPFVRTHQPAEDCSVCHNPHGTTVDNLLKSRPPFLCQQCHEPTSHRGAIPTLNPATGSTGAINVTGARACLNCHTNLHGSNNPADATGQRGFRR